VIDCASSNGRRKAQEKKAMIVCQCDVCGATAKPRTFYDPVMIVAPTVDGKSNQVEPTQITIPTGWSELRTFLGADHEIPIASRIEPIAPGSMGRISYQPMDVHYLTKAWLAGEDPKERSSLKDLYVGALRLGRLSWDDPSAIAEHRAESFEFPDEFFYRKIMPWTPLTIDILNKATEVRMVQLQGLVVPTAEAGLEVKMKVRYLCPDHTPKTNEEKPVLIDRSARR
jgi:hypothetical protein